MASPCISIRRRVSERETHLVAEATEKSERVVSGVAAQTTPTRRVKGTWGSSMKGG